MATITLELGPTTYELDCETRLTGRAQRGESSDFEVFDLRLYRLTLRHSRGVPGQPNYRPAHWERSDALPIPAWLLDDLETAAMESDEAQEAADEQAEASRRPDPDEAYERARDARMEAGL